MMNAYEKLMRANREAVGYIELAQMGEPGSPSWEAMRQKAVESLSLLAADALEANRLMNG